MSFFFHYRKRQPRGRGPVQDLHGQPGGLRDARVRPHVHLYQLRKANVRVSHLQAVCSKGSQDIQVVV
jgi:hypothetical protein